MSESRPKKRKVEFIESYWTGGELGSDYQWNDNHGELIRCKDCKYWRKLLLNHNGDGACHADNPIRVSNQNWFCADGVAKDIIPDKKAGETDG